MMGSSSDRGGRTAGVTNAVDDVYLHLALQSATKLPDGAAHPPVLHLPLLQHLVHHLWQAVAVTVMLDGLYFHGGQIQSARKTLPFGSDVFPHQIQVLLGHSVVL